MNQTLTFPVSLRFVMIGLSCVAAACGGEELPGNATTKQACDAMASPAPTSVALEGFSGGPGPTLSTQPTPYVASLVATVAPGQFSGHAQWSVPSDGTFGIYVSPRVTFLVRDAQRNTMPFIRRLGAPASCETLDHYGFIDLKAGTYSIEFGPAPTQSVRILLIQVVEGDKL